MWLTPSFSWGQMSSFEWDLAWLPYIKHQLQLTNIFYVPFLALLFFIELAVLCWAAQSCQTLCNPMDCSLPDSSVHGNSPGKNTGVGCHDLLQGIFLTQGLNPGLLHCRQTLYHPSHQGSPFIALIAYNIYFTNPSIHPLFEWWMSFFFSLEGKLHKDRTFLFVYCCIVLPDI